MNDKVIPEGWVECAPSVCTQVWILLAGSMLPANRNLDHDMAVRVNGEWISEKNWPILGIVPIRKAPPPGPIEFVVEGITYYANMPYMALPSYKIKPGMRFREVVEE